MLRIVAASLLIMTSITAVPAADLIVRLTVEVVEQPEGNYIYNYSLVNDSLSTFSVLSLAFDVGFGADPQSVAGPENWDFLYFNLDLQNDYVAWETDDLDHVIPPGTNQNFSFMSSLGPTVREFTITGIDNDDIFNGGDISGAILGPGLVVPEPSTITLVCIGTIAVVASRGCSLRQWFRDSLAKVKPTDSCS